MAAMARVGPGRRRGHRAPLPSGRPHLRVRPYPDRPAGSRVAPHRARPAPPRQAAGGGWYHYHLHLHREGRRPLLPARVRAWLGAGRPATTPVHQRHREGREREREGAGGEDPLARAEGPQPAIRRAVHGVGWASVMVVRCLGRRIAPRQRIVAEAVPAPGSLGLTAAPDDVRLMYVLRRLDPWRGILVCAAAG